MRSACLAWHVLWCGVCLSVRLSVTLIYYVETAVELGCKDSKSINLEVITHAGCIAAAVS